jgi:hypothetical protein
MGIKKEYLLQQLIVFIKTRHFSPCNSCKLGLMVNWYMVVMYTFMYLEESLSRFICTTLFSMQLQ